MYTSSSHGPVRLEDVVFHLQSLSDHWDHQYTAGRLENDPLSSTLAKMCERWQQQNSPAYEQSNGSTESREAYRGCFNTIVQDVASCYFDKAQDLLEIGCGPIGSDGLSFLAKSLPRELAQRVRYTDGNPGIGMGIDGKLQGAVTVLDARQLSTGVKAGSLDTVVSCCALDTIRRGDLPEALKQIYTVLKPGGVLMEVSDYYPYFNALCDAFVKPDTLQFPWEKPDGTNRGIQVVSRQALNAFLRESGSQLQPIERQLLNWYAAMTPSRSEELTNTLMLTNDIADMRTSSALSGWMERLNIPGKQNVGVLEHYDSCLREGLASAGFTVREIGHRSEMEIVKVGEGADRQHNYVTCTKGHFYRRRIYVLSPGHIAYHLTARILVVVK